MPLTFFQDIKERGLIPIKVLLFLQAAGDMAVYPFLTLHMKYLGISLTEIGIQFALSPIATLIATPLVGLLADKIGNFKIMLSISLLLVAVLSQLFILIPSSIDHVNLPSGEARLSCSSDSTKFLIADVSRNFTLQERTFSNITNDYSYTNGLDVTLKRCTWICTDPKNSKVCFHRQPDKKKCVVPSSVNTLFVKLKKIGGEDTGKWNFESTRIEKDSKEKFESAICPVADDSCYGVCQVRLNKVIYADPGRRQFTFWTYLALRILLYVIIATEMSLLKAASLTLVDKYDSEYGFQRIWPTLAACVMPLVTGFVMDKLQDGEVEDYNPCFYIFGGMKLVMAILTLFVDLSAKPPTLELWKNVTKLFKNPEVCIMLIYCTFVGSCWGYLETFLFLFLEGLGATKLLMGLTFTIGSAAGLPLTILAGAIERRIGHIPIISIGLFAYAVRFVGYTFISNAYQALIFEALECLTMSLMLITITTYANILSSVELVATMQATWAALHFAVGRALGSVVGGFMIDSLGSVITYRVYAIKCVFMGTLYLLLYFFWLRRKHSAKDEHDKNDEEKCGKADINQETLEKHEKDPEIKKEKDSNLILSNSDSEEKNGKVVQSPNGESRFLVKKITESIYPSLEDKPELEMTNLNSGILNQSFQADEEHVSDSKKQA